VLANRMPRFVNAPALMHAGWWGSDRRQPLDITLPTPGAGGGFFCDVLSQAGYKFLKAQGRLFYLFPKAPKGDDLGGRGPLRQKTSWRCREGFWRAGLISVGLFALVSEQVITAAAPGFAAARKKMAG